MNKISNKAAGQHRGTSCTWIGYISGQRVKCDDYKIKNCKIVFLPIPYRPMKVTKLGINNDIERTLITDCFGAKDLGHE